MCLVLSTIAYQTSQCLRVTRFRARKGMVYDLTRFNPSFLPKLKSRHEITVVSLRFSGKQVDP